MKVYQMAEIQTYPVYPKTFLEHKIIEWSEVQTWKKYGIS